MGSEVDGQLLLHQRSRTHRDDLAHRRAHRGRSHRGHGWSLLHHGLHGLHVEMGEMRRRAHYEGARRRHRVHLMWAAGHHHWRRRRMHETAGRRLQHVGQLCAIEEDLIGMR